MARTRDDASFEAQRVTILRAAAGCFARQGFHAASIADICLAAGGLSPGRLYHYFSSKQAMVEALATAERAELAGVAKLAARKQDPILGLLALVRLSVRRSLQPDYARLALEIVSESGRNPAIGAIVAAADDDFRRQVIAAVARVRLAGGKWHAREDASLARSITAIIDGCTVRALLEPRARGTLVREAERMTARLLG
ncbi:MAG: helix-turn-helix domain-containing protein [Alphaproteobacteria bacterium]|nr:helix-turn-helix domain-containing protein [Alphaproteobacteria bacterium]